ncbi:transposase, partial [Phocaeicola sp.]|uniref:transposase n=1 Tax=Phocaeicola sp. TaxID=2773926 RepID=UPI003AB447D9
DTALTRLARWYDEVDRSGFLAFGRVARSIQTHYLEIINFFEKRSTNEFPPFWLPNLIFGGIPKDTKKPANSQHFVYESVG